MPALILASTSRYRAELLKRLGIPFTTARPDVDETALPGETPVELALRLAQAKAFAVASMNPESVVIGSDQVAEHDGEALGKPGDLVKAVAQLERMSGSIVTFHTAICVARGRDAEIALVPTEVEFRTLSRVEIERYVARDNPIDCAGSFKSEALGIALFERVTSDDPTALIGLPLIETAKLLRVFGIDPLAA